MITPKRPSGFNEFSPADQMAFNAMLSVIRFTYEQYGYGPIETPALELAPVLLAKEGGETAKQVYRFSKGDTDLALRFDLTVPLARYVAEHFHELAFPFRRYQIQEVWRAEKPQAGRFRQFYQCDIDILGSAHPAADADVLLTARAALRALGLNDALLKISHRGLLGGFLEARKLGKYKTEVLRAVDKLDKRGVKGVTDELKTAGLKQADIKDLLSLITIAGPASDVLKKLASLSIDQADFKKAIADLSIINTLLKAAKLKPSEYSIDLSIARGLDYYTGMVFETFLKKSPDAGSICSGGRYDNLLGTYRKESLPGVGASIGVSRLFSAIKERLGKGPSSPAQVLVISFTEELAPYALEVAAALRHGALNVLSYPGFDKAGKQLGYADKLGIPVAVLCGEDEARKKSVTIKSLKTGKQTTASLKKAAAVIRKLL